MNQTFELCHKMKIPDRLDRLMSRLTQEIIRQQPENVYEFAANLFEQLLEERNGANGNTMLESFPEASSRQSSARTPERITKDNVEKLNEDGSEYYDDTDDYDRELQHLQDNKIGTEDNTSPPPTLDESLSDHNPSPAPIVATVTLKTLDSPRSFTTTSRPANDMTDVALSNFSTDLGNDILSESSSTPTSTQQLCEPDGTIVCDESVEIENAAICIQSAYRGHRTRRELRNATEAEANVKSAKIVDCETEDNESSNLDIEVADGAKESHSSEINKECDLQVELICNEIDENSVPGAHIGTESKESNGIDAIQAAIIDAATNEELALNDISSSSKEEEAKVQLEKTEDILLEILEEQSKDCKAIENTEDLIENIEQIKINGSCDGFEETSEENEAHTEGIQMEHENGVQEEQITFEAKSADEDDKKGKGETEELCSEAVNKPAESVIENDEPEQADEDKCVTEIQNIETINTLGNGISEEDTVNKVSIDNRNIIEGHEIQFLGKDESIEGNKTVILEETKTFTVVQDVTSTEGPHTLEPLAEPLSEEHQQETHTDEIMLANEQEFTAVDQTATTEEQFKELKLEDIQNTSVPETGNYVAYGAGHEIDNFSETESQNGFENTENEEESVAVSGTEESATEIEKASADIEDLSQFSEINTSHNEPEVRSTIDDTGKTRHNVNNQSHDVTLIDDEEEIWQKLQKDIQMEEEEQQNLAAIRIQSSFRGYKTRKDLNQFNRNERLSDEIQDADEITGNENSAETDELPKRDYACENGNEEELTEALADLTGTIASVALFMVDTSNSAQSEQIENSSLKSDYVPLNPNEVHDVAEEPLSNGEQIDDVQLINSYIIKTAIVDGRDNQPEQHFDVNSKKEEELFSEKDNLTISRSETENVAPDPEVVFELYVESNETTNDGLLDSSWQPQQENFSVECKETKMSHDSVKRRSDTVSLQEEIYLNSEEYAATKIQAGYRGYRDRKFLKSRQNSNGFDSPAKDSIVDNTLPDEDEKNAAATKIQARYKGQRDRKRVQDMKGPKGMHSNNCILKVDEDEIRIVGDANQSELAMALVEKENTAATKIQASYRGHRDRKRVSELKNDKNFDQTPIIEELGESFAHYKHIEVTQTSYEGQEDCKRTDNFKKYNSIEEASSINDDDNSSCFELENAAATKIQAGYRGQRDRKRFKKLKDPLINESPVTIYDADFNSSELEHAAATKIQAGYRGHRDRKRLHESKVHREDEPLPEELDEVDADVIQRENAAATKIQAGYRGQRERKRLHESKVHREDEPLPVELDEVDADVIQRENAAATKIQAGYRGQRERKRLHELKVHGEDEPLPEELGEVDADVIQRENAAATKIQAGYRGHRDRKRLHESKVHREDEPLPEELDEVDADVIQRENAAATKIQAGYRGQRERKRLKNLEDPHTDEMQIGKNNTDVYSLERENIAATKIQAGYRGHRDRKRLHDSKVHRTEKLIEETDVLGDTCADAFQRENEAATKIQASYRGQRDRKRIKELKYPTEETITISEIPDCNDTVDEVNEQEDEAATKIQAVYRGRRERKRLNNTQDYHHNNETSRTGKTVSPIQSEEMEDTPEMRSDCLQRENAAATKIQAGYRGHMDRKRLREEAGCTKPNTIILPDLLEDYEQDHGKNYRDRQQRQLNNQNFSINAADETDRANEEPLLVKPGFVYEYDYSGPNDKNFERENAAATKIQSGYRGHRDRKRLEKKKDLKPDQSSSDESHNFKIESKSCELDEKTDVLERRYSLPNTETTSRILTRVNSSSSLICVEDVNLPNAEEELAAIKIQSTYRGHRVRKENQMPKNA